MINSKINVLAKQLNFAFKPRSVVLFIIAAIIASGLNIGGEIIFPSQNLFPYFARTTISLIVLAAFVIITIKLLRQNGLSSKVLGLQLSGQSVLNLTKGLFIGVCTIVLMVVLLYVFVPYHFVKGALNGMDVLKESYSYFLGNSLEELLFRGFLLIILSQLIGWRIAVFIMAVPFGLFHLYFLGLNMAGLKMVITTAAFSLVFSYGYILTGSIWTAIGIHVSSNILLHAVLGLDGANRAMFVPLFDYKWPVNYDLGMVISLLLTTIVASCLFLLIKYKYRTPLT